MLDLSIYTVETEEVILPNGDTIHILKPTEGLILKMIDYSQQTESLKKVNSKNKTEVINAVSKASGILNGIVAEILSNNADNRKFTADEIKNIVPFDKQQVLIKWYTQWGANLVNQDF